MKNLTRLWLFAILSTIFFSACTDDCDKYQDNAIIHPEMYNWFPSANTFPNDFTSNLGNERSVTFSSDQGQLLFEGCDTKTYEWMQFVINLDDNDRIKMSSNNSNINIGALFNETETFTFSGLFFLAGTTLQNGQLLDSLTINGNNYADVFLVTSYDDSSILDSIVLQYDTEFISFKYKDEIWTNEN